MIPECTIVYTYIFTTFILLYEKWTIILMKFQIQIYTLGIDRCDL